METSKDQLIAIGDHEPLLRLENEGLVIQAFEIDGECVLDFDWPSDSRWTFLEDEATFQAFAIQWLEEVTGHPMSATEIEQLHVSSAVHARQDSGHDQAQQGEPQQSEANQGACQLKEA